MYWNDDYYYVPDRQWVIRVTPCTPSIYTKLCAAIFGTCEKQLREYRLKKTCLFPITCFSTILTDIYSCDVWSDNIMICYSKSHYTTSIVLYFMLYELLYSLISCMVCRIRWTPHMRHAFCLNGTIFSELTESICTCYGNGHGQAFITKATERIEWACESLHQQKQINQCLHCQLIYAINTTMTQKLSVTFY